MSYHMWWISTGCGKPLSGQGFTAVYGSYMIRLRQIALVAHSLNQAIADITAALDVDVIYRDPGVGFFGLHNALFCIGDQFLEVVSPIQEGTTAGRLLAKLGGDGGYMALYEVDDLDARIDHVKSLGVRTVWEGTGDAIRGRHLHPRDTGGTLVSLDQPDMTGEWAWGGPDWKSHRPSSVVSSIDSFTVSVPDPEFSRIHWTQLGISEAARFVAWGDQPEGVTEVTMKSVDSSRDGETLNVCGVTITLRA
jgi:Glyoxalase-like domain